MFREKWSPAEGTIAAARTEPTVMGTEPTRVYDVDVMQPDGRRKRMAVRALPQMTGKLAVGTAVRVEVSSKTGEARFDGARSFTTMNAGLGDAAPSARTQRTNSAALATAFGLESGAAAAQADPEFHAAARQVLTELLQELRTSTDRSGARVRAQARLEQLQAEYAARRDQAPGQQPPELAGRYAADSPHILDRPDAEDLAAPAGMTPSPQITGQRYTTEELTGQHFPGQQLTSQQLASESFGGAPTSPPAGPQPTAWQPSGTPPGSGAFGTSQPSPAGAGSFGAGSSGTGAFGSSAFGAFGADGKDERIAQLRDMRIRGQLTDEQFETQRQQIIDGA